MGGSRKVRARGEIQWRRFPVVWNVANPDPHGFDGDGDGIGCES